MTHFYLYNYHLEQEIIFQIISKNRTNNYFFSDKYLKLSN